MPREKIFVKGDTIDARFDCIEGVLQRFSRRLGQFCAVYIPPFPLSIYVDAPDSDGVLLRYIFPCKGTLGNCAAFFMNAPSTHMVEMNFISKGTSRIWEVEAGREALFDLNLNVEPGDRITISSYYGAWIGIAYQVAENEALVKEIVLDLIDKEAVK